MAGATNERNPRIEQEQTVLLSPGTARFMIAAQADLGAKRYFNPDWSTMPQQKTRRELLEKATPQRLDIHLVNKLSTESRQGKTAQREQAGRTKETQMVTWATGMVQFLKQLGSTASPELVDLTRKRLCVNLKQTNEAVLFEQVEALWDKYLRKGSDIGRFLTDLLAGIPDTSAGSIVEVQKRIALIDPFLGMFGDERIGMLIKDAGSALVFLSTKGQERKQVLDMASKSIQQSFASPLDKSAYQLLWETIKDTLPEERASSSSTSQAAGLPLSPAQQQVAATHTPEPTPSSAPPPEKPVAPRPIPTHQRQPESTPSGPAEPKVEPPTPQGSPSKVEEKRVVASPIAPLYPPGKVVATDITSGGDQAQPGLQQERIERVQPQSEKQRPFPTSAAVVARNPERPWISSDSFVVKELDSGGFILGAFDGIEKGGVYSAGVARKAREMVGKIVGKSNHNEPISVSVREIIRALGTLQPFMERVKTGAQQELTHLHATDEQKKEIIDNIGATGLVALTAQEEDKTVLVTANLGNARLVSYNPDSGQVKSLTVDHLAPHGILERGARLFGDNNQQFLNARNQKLSHSVQQKDVEMLEEKLRYQQRVGWSQQDSMLRVFPLQKGNVYVLLTNGITLNIPPAELPAVIERAYIQATMPGGAVDVSRMVRLLVREAQKRMRRPEQYRVSVRGKVQPYVVKDTAGAAAVLYQ